MAKKIMFQGTGSSVGKSIIVAAVCRILNNHGYSVAPFKSQNMSLNSFITDEGKEMGRAQVVQAEAARIKPMVEMNPILLKPTSDVGSQVVLNGDVFKNMDALKYFSSKDYLVPHIQKAFETLSSKYEVIVIEGAGSPAEINLRSRDIVNMGLAEIIDTDVLLIGDVDKGGVFASLYGTFLLLSDLEKERIKGFVINKFRGDVTLLMPGVEMLEKLINRPCLGVIPFIVDLKVDDEDSVTERFDIKREKCVKIGVVKLPYMSNFTDFTVFDMETDVSLEYVDHLADLTNCDLIIIPGSKNTIHDMRFLSESGFNQAIYKAHRKGIPIIGICGGYQILGQTIEDPYGVESYERKINGLGLLDVVTQMAKIKTTRQATGMMTGEFWGIDTLNKPLNGYEIHMGETQHVGVNVVPFMKTDLGTLDGAIHIDGNILGTYYHGIFDNDHFRSAILNRIRQKKGMQFSTESTSYEILKQNEYDRLAHHVESHLDIEAIKKILDASRQ